GLHLRTAHDNPPCGKACRGLPYHGLLLPRYHWREPHSDSALESPSDAIPRAPTLRVLLWAPVSLPLLPPIHPTPVSPIWRQPRAAPCRLPQAKHLES